MCCLRASKEFVVVGRADALHNNIHTILNAFVALPQCHCPQPTESIISKYATHWRMEQREKEGGRARPAPNDTRKFP